jgi:protein SCO1
MRTIGVFIFFSMVLFSCTTSPTKLPKLGNTIVENGREVSPKIRKFDYLNQDSIHITNDSLKNNIYITDFFFTSCPSICPKVMKQMLTLHDEFKNEELIKLVSFTLDPKRDTVGKLADYATKIGVKSNKWLFLTGDKDFTLELANDYFVSALEDASAPGGFDHSGKIVLVDKEGHVRAFCEGTDPESIPKFKEEIKLLLKEYKQ